MGNGLLTIRGDADGNTGGMSYRDARKTGRWEMRAKFPKGDPQYHPVLLLWPGDGGSDDGEVDFAETTSASDSVSFFLHHGSGDQKVAEKTIDLTQWHNYAVEVTSRGVTGFIDGQKWFESTDPDTLPRGPVHPVIQLDWFPKGDSPSPRSSRSTGCGSTSRANHFSRPPRPELPTGRGGVVSVPGSYRDAVSVSGPVLAGVVTALVVRRGVPGGARRAGGSARTSGRRHPGCSRSGIVAVALGLRTRMPVSIAQSLSLRVNAAAEQRRRLHRVE